MKVVFHVEALHELHDARVWYAERGAPEQGLRLLRAVDAKVEEIAGAPESFPRDPMRSWARRARILRWPYTLIFFVREVDSVVVVLAVAHGKRRARYWARRRES